MDVLKAIKSRREITKYLDQKIETDVLEAVVDATYYAPTGNNLPSKDIIVVTDHQKLIALKDTTPFMPWIEQAKAAIAITGRPDVSKYWLQDSSIAAGYCWLEAVEQGLVGAFGAIYHAEDQEESEKREKHARTILSIPEDRRVVAIIGLGYPAETKPPKEHIAREKIVHYEGFQQ
ncbi:nitroreductase family protein [Gracilibacillus sp. S3-1-1]|uniref:Nitroreductase family protein n=1 Tax=Gracilibacillus pellucidus TaxID=3095368 RepID=A0ACC6M0Q8_9BACI|nr:nitroreductase family protein [Gracilibacillus sp. S3-1-1]MDX8044527.1 nitroreductase family protein [Gracilibacillus sp. S3-1-1]